jgi:hypothetical protein
MLSRGGFTRGGLGLGLCGDVAIRIEATNGAITFAEDARAFLDLGLDVVDEFLFIELFFWRSVGFLNKLW